MRASTDLDTLTDFFDRYGVALTAGDVPAIAGCYALLTMVAVEWEFLDSQGRKVPGERYRYLLRTTDHGPAICTVVRTA